MLGCFNRLEPDEGNLHGAEEANDEEGVVSHVNSRRVAIHQQEHKHVKRNL